MSTLPVAHPAQPIGRGSSRVVLVVLIGVASMTLWGLAISIITIMGPKYVEMFRDFGVVLPGFTQMFISVINQLKSPVMLAVAVGLPLVITCVLGIAAARGDRAGFVALVLFALAAILPIVAFFAAMLIPTMHMTQSLQGGAV